jgi:hypothetical protein
MICNEIRKLDERRYDLMSLPPNDDSLKDVVAKVVGLHPDLDEMDWIFIKQRLAAVAKTFRGEQIVCEKLAESDDKVLAKHKAYWLKLARSEEQKAEFVDSLWKALPSTFR